MALTGCDSLPERARTRGDPAVSETVIPNSVSGAAVGMTRARGSCQSRRPSKPNDVAGHDEYRLGQLADATPACGSNRRWSLKASAGVFQFRLLRGRVLTV